MSEFRIFPNMFAAEFDRQGYWVDPDGARIYEPYRSKYDRAYAYSYDVIVLTGPYTLS